MKRGVLGLFIVLTALVAAPSALAIAACGSVAATDTLTANVSGTGTCITITGDNLVFDCLGNTITFDTSGGSYSSGILMTNRRNVTIQNCVIRDPNGSSIGSIGINATNVNNSQILNNNIQTNGTNQSHGIVFFANSSNLFISNNTIDVYGSSQVSHGIYYVSFNPNPGQANNSLIVGNNITVRNGAIFYRSQFGANHTFANNTGLQFGGASNVQGFFVGVTNNVTISGNNLTFNGTLASGHVTLSGTNYTNITGNNFYSFNSTSLITATNNGFRHTWTNNMFFMSGPTASSTLLTVNGINNTEIRNNTFYCDDGSCISAGGSVSGNVTISNNIFNSANASTFGGSTYMLSINGLENSALYNNILIQPSNSSAYREWTLQLAGVNLNFTNTTFMTSFGSVNYPFFAINSSQITGSRLNISNNRIRVDSASVPALNTSAQITLFNASPLSPGRLLVDYSDSGAYVPCSDCSNAQFFNNGTVQFNVTRFTSYSANNSFPATVNETSNLTSNITVNGSAFVIGASNIVFDCQGFTITGNGTGTGIDVTNRTNVTIRNCIIDRFNQNIMFSRSNNSAITNVTAYNGTAETIEMFISTNNIFDGITAVSNGSVTFNITLGGSHTLKNSRINATRSNVALSLDSNTVNNTVYNVTMGSFSGNAILLSSANNTNLTDITAFSNSSDALGIGTSHHNLIYNANLLGGSSGSYGISMSSSNNHTFRNVNITSGQCIAIAIANGSTFDNIIANANSSICLSLASGSHNHIFSNSTFNGSTAIFLSVATNNSFDYSTLVSSDIWISVGALLPTNFSNTTFYTQNGTISIPGKFVINSSSTVSVDTANINVTFNRSFVNSTNLTFLNQSAKITLHNVNVNTTGVDFNDDGTYEACNATQCQLESFNGSTIVFNVSSFTSYAAVNFSAGNACPGTISTDTTLTSDVSSTGNCVTFNADNIFLDCNGYTMTWDTGGTGSDAVIASSRTNVTVRNCGMADGNSGGTDGYGVTFSTVTNSFIINNTIQTNGTDNNYGLRLVSGSNSNYIANNTVRSNGSGDGNIAIFVDSSNNNLIFNNTILPYGGGSNPHGIEFSNANNNNITQNNITKLTNVGNAIRFGNTCQRNIIDGNFINMTSDGQNTIEMNNNYQNTTIINNYIADGGFRGVLSNANGENLNVTNNTIFLRQNTVVVGILINSQGSVANDNKIYINTSNNAYGVRSTSGVSNGFIQNNYISFNTTASGYGISLEDTTNSIISGNNVSINSTTTDNRGIRTEGATNNNNITNNILNVNGTGSSYGIIFTANTHNNLVENNNILVQTGSQNEGIHSNTGSSNRFFNNNITVFGSLNNRGIRFFNNANNNTASNNIINVNGTTSYGVFVDGTANIFNNNTLNNTEEWIQTSTGAQGNFTNTTFQTQNGSIFISGLVQLDNVKLVTRNVLNISLNSAYVNSTNMSALNQSAQILLRNIPPSNPQPIVDFEDDGTFVSCNSPQCVVINSSNITFIMNVSSFTNYSTEDTAACPGIITSDTNLTENITAMTTGSCVQFGADNIVLDCQGYTMTGNGSGVGINATSRTNVEIRNCNVATFNRNILFSGTSNSRLLSSNTTNSTDINIFFSTSGSNNNLSNLVVNHNATTADAIQFFVAGANQLRNISIFLRGTGGSGAGVYFFGSSDNSLDNLTSYAESTFYDHVQITSTALRNNVSNIVVSNGSMLSASTSSNFIIFNNARGTNSIVSISTANNIVDNVTLTGSSSSQMFTASGSSSNYSNINVSNSGGQGVALGGSADRIINLTTIGTIGMTVTGSTNALENIQSNATGIGQNSILISGSNNNVRNVTSQAGSGIGIGVSVASGNNISEFTVNEGYLSPISIQSGATNTIFTNGTINSNPTCSNCDGIALSALTNAILDNITIVSPTSSLFDWISTAASTSNASISNITFQTSSGSIKTIQNTTLPGPLNLNRDRLNISPNRAFLNSSNASFLNTTAQIILTNVNSSVLLVDFEDDGTFALCNPPQCVLQSFSSGTIVFNVSSFTSYSTSNVGGVNVTLSKTDSPDPINLSNTTILTYQINFTVTNGTAFNVTINETYPNNTTFINSSPTASSGNDGWNVGNLTAGQTYQINITINVSSSLANGTSLINTISATYENSTGSQFNLSVSEATIVINEIVVQTNATLTKTDSPDPLNISNSTLLTFQVNFTVNNGTAYNTTIIETYSGNVTFVNATPAPTTGNNNWSVGNITAPGVYQINITVNVSNSLSNGSIVTNTVNATYENATGSSFNIDATTVTTILVDAAPANATVVSLTKTDSPDPLNISSTTLLTYQINFTVTNGTAINTTINETYPSNATFVNATPTPTTGNNSWSAGNISAGTTYQINITLNVSSALSNGTILTNTVNTTYSNATGSTLTANVQQNTTVIRNLEFNATVITMTKIDAPDPVIAGQNLIYTITINVTNGTAFNTTLTDSYPSQVSFVSATPAANSSNNTWIVGNLTAGQSFQVNITVNVNSSTANGTTINNTANISYANQTGSILTLNATAQTTVSTQSFPIVINNNTNITTNGSTTGPGIIINSSNVTVNCNGNIITGSGSSVGVNITGFNNVTIQNCVFVNFAAGAHVENSNINQFTSNTFRTVTSGVNLLGTSQNSAFNHTIIAASSDWVFTSAASSGNIFQNTSYNDTGGQIIITPSVTFAANTNASQSRLDITSPDAFLNSTALPFLDAASRVTITGITNTNTALILGDFDDDGTYEICSAPTCTLVSFASGTAIFDTSGWTSYTVVDGGVNFTLTKTSSPDPVTPGNNVVFTITATVNSGFAQNITVVESPPAELMFVTSTPTNISDNTWLLNNLSAGQSAQINVTYAVNSSFSGTIQNNVSVTFQNSTNGTVTTNVSQNTTAQFPSTGGGQGGGGGGGSGAAICPPFCQYPENKDLPVCRNNCPPAQAPAQQDFGAMFPPVSDSVPPVEEPIVEEPAKEETVVEETPVEEPKPVKSKFFPWWYVLIAIVAIVFMIWETHHILGKIHKPSKEQSKLDKIDKDIARMRKMLKK